jgi:iron complex transport system permease protein
MTSLIQTMGTFITNHAKQVNKGHANKAKSTEKNTVMRLLSAQDSAHRRYLYALGIALPIVVIWAMSSGAINIDILKLLSTHLFVAQDELNASTQAHILSFHQHVLWDIRVPRIGMTLLTGAGLAISGVVLQTLCRNPLADPGLIGVSSGAALFAAFGIMLLSSSTFSSQLSPWVATSLIPIFASIGSIIALMLLLSIAGGKTGLNTLMLILAGVAINAGAMTLLGFINYVVDDATLRQITFWSMGSYAGIDFLKLTICLLVIAPASFIISKHIGQLMLVSTGEKQATFQGVNVKQLKLKCLFAVSAIVAVSVSFTGIVGFVGLVVPHICRMLLGSHLKVLLPSSALLGALLVTMADTLARTLLIPAELPIGLLTSVIGVPFFLYLIVKEKRKFQDV